MQMRIYITRYILLLSVVLLFSVSANAQKESAPLQGKGTVTGRIYCPEEKDGIINFATVYLKDTTLGAVTDENGVYVFTAPEGQYTLTVSAAGYKTEERLIHVTAGQTHTVDFGIQPQSESLDGSVVTAAGGVGKINKSAFNAVAVDTKELRNTTQNLSEALTKLPGMKLRESGGVGSDMSLMLDGFSGKHIKVFIDGVPQEGVGSSFGLNNIPVNFAERIEVYKGVVPVGFGTDALGGVINIVTNKSRRKWFLDASYSYGSFNTHKSYVNFGQTFRSGFMYEVNVFQNYSDNNYWVDTPVEIFNEDGTSTIDNSDIRRVRRFNDTYHNEAAIAKLGFVDKKFADRMVLSFTYSRFYKEIQTGVRQDVVFGQKHRRGWSLMPSFEYVKKNFSQEVWM